MPRRTQEDGVMSHLETGIMLVGFILLFFARWRNASGKPWQSLKQGLMLVHFHIVTYYFVAF